MPSTPIITLIEPQLAENIGMAARAMANMGLCELRLVNPRESWPNEKAIAASSGADEILAKACLYDDVAEAIADCHFVYATSARKHRQAKLVAGPMEAARSARARIRAGQKIGVLFGRERNGLLKDEISLANAILTFPVSREFPSLNLAQAVLLFGYSWLLSQGEEGELLPYVTELGSKPATSGQIEGLFDHLTGALKEYGYFKPAHRENVMKRNLRNIIKRMILTEQDIQTLHGVVTALENHKEEL